MPRVVRSPAPSARRRRARALRIAGLVVMTGCGQPTAGSHRLQEESHTIAPVVTAAAVRPVGTTAVTASTRPPSAPTPRAGADAVDGPASVSAIAERTTPPVADHTPYVVPVADPTLADWGTTHSSYRATDIFVVGGCGGGIVSPVNGIAVEVRTVDQYDPDVDNPATRGGRSVSILGDDGVRYYLAHFATIAETVVVGVRLDAGQPLGTVGDTGRAGGCHIHFGISPLCPDKEWSVRRGAIWPYPYLDAWKVGDQLSPEPEIEAWVAANPTACAAASADPYAPDS